MVSPGADFLTTAGANINHEEISNKIFNNVGFIFICNFTSVYETCDACRKK